MAATAFDFYGERRWTIPEFIGDDTARDPYRYLFGWRWAAGPIVIYVGLNPSTMTASVTDHTGRKWEGFARRGGFGGYIAVNAFGLRATNPRTLVPGACSYDPVGLDNDTAIRDALAFSGVTKVIACWGRPPSVMLKTRLNMVRRILTDAGPVWCWGLTADSEPRHPLMLKYETPLQRLWP